MKNDFLDSAKKQFEYYKILGEKTFAQLSDEQLFWQYNEERNSIATVSYTHLDVYKRQEITDLLIYGW